MCIKILLEQSPAFKKDDLDHSPVLDRILRYMNHTISLHIKQANFRGVKARTSPTSLILVKFLDFAIFRGGGDLSVPRVKNSTELGELERRSF